MGRPPPQDYTTIPDDVEVAVGVILSIVIMDVNVVNFF
jgi:hypothetical protein